MSDSRVRVCHAEIQKSIPLNLLEGSDGISLKPSQSLDQEIGRVFHSTYFDDCLGHRQHQLRLKLASPILVSCMRAE